MARCPAGAPLWGARLHVDRGRPQAPTSAASASPAATRPPPSPAGTSYLQCGPRDLGEPRRYASYEEWLAKSGSGSTVSRLIEHAPSRRRPTDCPTPRLLSRRRFFRLRRAGTRRPRSSSRLGPSFTRERGARGAADARAAYGALLKSRQQYDPPHARDVTFRSPALSPC